MTVNLTYNVPLVFGERKTEAMQHLDLAWADRELALLLKGKHLSNEAMHVNSGDRTMDMCPICQSPGVVMTDERGTKIEHANRAFPCRVGWRMVVAEIHQRVLGLLDQVHLTPIELCERIGDVPSSLVTALATGKGYSSLGIAVMAEYFIGQGFAYVTTPWLLTGHR